jgi:hypothetical protein
MSACMQPMPWPRHSSPEYFTGINLLLSRIAFDSPAVVSMHNLPRGGVLRAPAADRLYLYRSIGTVNIQGPDFTNTYTLT